MSSIEQRFASAVQSHQSGRFAEAEGLYRGILAESPDHADALHLLGVLAHQAGHHAAAEGLINRALAVAGPDPVYLYNLASVSLALGRPADAATQARSSLGLNPDEPRTYHRLGVAARRIGRWDEAEAAFAQAVRLAPGYADAHYSLGSLLNAAGRLKEARTHLEEAARLAPANAQARNDLGSVLLALGDHDAAAAHLREAIRLKPDLACAYTNLGLTFRDARLIGTEAEWCFREAVRLDPGSAACHSNLADNLKQQGRIGDAAAEYREAHRLEPGNAIALAGLCALAAAGALELMPDEARSVDAAAADPRLSGEDRCRLLFALAGVHDRAGRSTAAFEEYRRANDLRRDLDRRAGIAYNPDGFAGLIDRVIAAFAPQYFERVRGFGSDSDVPVFVVGVMRSGTTLVEQILASHPQVYGAGELSELAWQAGGLAGRLGAAVGFPDCMSLLDGATARAVAAEYLGRLREMSGADRVIDKMPSNFLFLGLIATLFPKARVIHCRRDPVDTCLSCYFQDFASPHPYTSDLRHVGHYYRQYERLMAHWAAVLPAQPFDLQYEQLTTDQEGVSRRLVEYLGLPWDDRCLHFEENKRVVRTASSLQVRKPIYKSSVGRWKQYEPFLGPLLEELGRGR